MKKAAALDGWQLCFSEVGGVGRDFALLSCHYLLSCQYLLSCHYLLSRQLKIGDGPRAIEGIGQSDWEL